jgi:hypothetical protein
LPEALEGNKIKDCIGKQENGLQKYPNHSLLKFFSMNPKSFANLYNFLIIKLEIASFLAKTK